MTERTIRVLFLSKATWGPGATPYRWVAWFAGDEKDERSPRGYGATESEARQTLELGRD
jgi:hypothetical protein